MYIKKYANGPKKIIWFVVDDKGGCPAEDFLDRSDANGRKKLLRLLDYTAKNGPPRNEEKFKPLDNGPVYEFKCHTPALRLFCFAVDKRSKQVIGYVLTHGAIKPGDRKKDYDPHIKRTLGIMSELLQKGVI